MKIGVLADTHLRAGQSLPQAVWTALAEVDIIFHAGDSVAPEVLADLNCLAPTVAVKGNCDGWELQHLPERQIIDCAGQKFGLIHGNTGQGRTTPDRAYQAFAKEQAQAVIFGHSHTPYLEWRNGVLLFNPGSPTAKRWEPYYSVGVVEVREDQIQARHIYFGEDGRTIPDGHSA